MRNALKIVVAAQALLLAFATQASAQGDQRGYESVSVGGSEGGPTGSSSSDLLPFTGLDLGVLILVGLVLALTGVGLARGTARD